jgi:hypothetical protein
VLTYASETRGKTTCTQQLLRHHRDEDNKGDTWGKTLGDKIRSDQLQQLSGIQDIVKWANVRRRE